MGKTKRNVGEEIYTAISNGKLVAFSRISTSAIIETINYMKNKGFVSYRMFMIYFIAESDIIGIKSDMFYKEYNKMLDSRPSAILDSLYDELKRRKVYEWQTS